MAIILSPIAKEMNYEIVFKDKYPPDPVDISPLLTRVKATKPDIIFVESHFKDGILAAKQMAELNVYAPVIIYGSASAAVPWHSTLGPAIAEYTSGSSQWEPLVAYEPWDYPNWYGPTLDSKMWTKWWMKNPDMSLILELQICFMQL